MLASKPSDHSERSDLVRGLGLGSAIAIVIGDTIGTGVFLVASDMSRAVGSATLVLIAWILGLLIVLLGAFCYAELGAAFPKAGGPYVYLGRGLGPLWGFLFGWMSSILERPVAMATLAAGFVRFLGFLFPIVNTPLFSSHIGRYEFMFTTAQPTAALIVVIVTAVNYFSVQIGGHNPGHCCRRRRVRNKTRRPGCASDNVVQLGNDWRLADSARSCDVGLQRL